MADVKWIKLNVGMFDGNSFKRIKKAKIGGESFRDKLTAVWFELMDFAGKCNADGQLIESQEIPFLSIDDIAILIDRETEELNLCMQYYIANGMVTVIDDIYMLTNWSKYQSTDKLAELREYNRLAQQKSRAKRRLTEGVNDKSMTSQECQDTDIDKEIEKDKEKETDREIEFIPAPPTPSPKPTRHKYGMYKNVLFSDEDYQKLQEEFPHDYSARIDRLSEYIASTGKSYKNHLATIRAWARKEKPTKENSSNPFLDMLREEGSMR